MLVSGTAGREIVGSPSFNVFEDVRRARCVNAASLIFSTAKYSMRSKFCTNRETLSSTNWPCLILDTLVMIAFVNAGQHSANDARIAATKL